jgi:hypothetical protein
MKHLYSYFTSGKHFSVVILVPNAHIIEYRAVEVVLNNNQCRITENRGFCHPINVIIFFYAVASTDTANFTFMLPCIEIDFFLITNQMH